MEHKLKRLFNRGCTDYSLLSDGDRILLALSGGKDSLVMARLMAERARIFKPRIQVEAAHVVMENVPYSMDLNYLQEFCSGLGLKLHILRTSFDESTDRRKTKCFLCAHYRRKCLFSFAQEQGFNKVALGHHMDDFLVTMLMNLMYEGSFSSMKPILPMEHYPLSIIRPLCLVPESEIQRFAEEEQLVRQITPCPYEDTTKRTTMEGIFAQLSALHPEARQSMWRALSRQWNPQNTN